MANFWKALSKPFTVLAPMDDVTDYVFRELLTEVAKPDVLVTEFTSIDALVNKGRDKALRKLQFSEKQRPIVAQIWGSKPEYFEKAASLIQELGFDGIDLNMGCPVKKIIKKGSGAYLINNLELVEKIIDSVKKGAPLIPLSIKTRVDTNSQLTSEWLSFLLSKNISALTLHGRTAAAMSKGEADWEEIGRVVDLRTKINPDIIIIGNGDVKSYKEVLVKHKKYNVDGVMIGRGVFANPWVFEKNIPETVHTKNDYLFLLSKHTKLFYEKWGNDKNFETMKKFFKIYIKSFRGADKIRQKLMNSKGYEEAIEIIEAISLQ